MSNGKGCKCFARSENECACGVNWNQAPLPQESIEKLATHLGIFEYHSTIVKFAREIEKAHGIG